MDKAHIFRYSIHPGSTKMHRNLREAYQWSSIKGIIEFVAKCSNCQKVKVENQRPGGMTQNIEIPLWKWQIIITMHFITDLPRSRRRHYSIWVIIDIMKKSSHFLSVKTIHSLEDYAKLYIQQVERLDRLVFRLYQIEGHNLRHNFENLFKKAQV